MERKFSVFYNNVAESPELAAFRRYTAISTWDLSCQNKEINRLEEECNALIETEYPGRRLTLTDLDPREVIAEHNELGVIMYNLQKLVRKSREDLYLAHNVARMPDQTPVFSQQLACWNLFANDRFLPTGDSEAFYKRTKHPDMAAIKAIDPQDVLTEMFMMNIKTLKGYLANLAFWKIKPLDVESQPAHEETMQPAQNMIQESVELKSIQGMVNLSTGLWACLLFTFSMVVVFYLKSPIIQIIVVGLLCCLLHVSFQFLVQDLKRGESFSIVGGYFAVMGIFIGATISDSGGR